MLRITVELVYQGDESKKSTIGVMEIGNDGTGTIDSGNYNVRMRTDRAEKWAKAYVKNFPRQERGPFHLIHASLRELFNKGKQ